MPSRNFCDICDSEIDKKDPIYGAHINTPEDSYQYNRNDVLQFYVKNPPTNRINIAYEAYMVCRSCIQDIRGHIQEMIDRAVQERKAKEVPVGEKAQDS